MFILIFSATFILNISHSKKSSARYYYKCPYVLMSSTRHSCQILMTLEFSQHIFEKSSNITLQENPCSGSRVVSCGQTDMTKVEHTYRRVKKIKGTSVTHIITCVLKQQCYVTQPNDVVFSRNATHHPLSSGVQLF